MANPDKQKPKPAPIEDAIARYQLTIEKQLEGLAKEMREAIGEMRTRLGELADWRQSIDGQLKDARNDIKDHAHRMDQGLREANVALRVAVEQTNEAKETVAVYERAREEAPDLSGSITEIARKQGTMQDNFNELREQVAAVAARLEEATQGDLYEENDETEAASEGAAIAEAILKREDELRQPLEKPRAARA